MYYHGETHMRENPSNLSYEYIFKIRTSIHHDHEYQTFPQMRVYINKETRYLYFHVGHVATTPTLALSLALAIEALSSSSHTMLASPC